ncbi:unnamed protein product [Arctogadus glacialis]
MRSNADTSAEQVETPEWRLEDHTSPIQFHNHSPATIILRPAPCNYIEGFLGKHSDVAVCCSSPQWIMQQRERASPTASGLYCLTPLPPTPGRVATSGLIRGGKETK